MLIGILLGLTGVMCNFTTPLKEANISIYALSTWLADITQECSLRRADESRRNTDYVLIPKDKIDEAVSVLQNDGWIFPKD